MANEAFSEAASDSGSLPVGDPWATRVFRSRSLPPEADEPEGVIGRFELLHKLGEGGFGRVYKARDTQNGSIVAIKILRSAIGDMNEVIERLRREFHATTTLDHPNIIRSFEFGQDGFDNSWTYFLVLEFVDGWDLSAAMQQLRVIPYEQACKIIRGVGSAVQHAHDNAMIHRDIKPHNILLPYDGETRLSDFGLVKDLAANSTLTRTNTSLGTPAFMPPEQYRDAKHVNKACDIYAIAMTFLLMVSGKYPFDSSNSADWLAETVAGLHISEAKYPQLDGSQRAAIQKALSPDPNGRHSSVGDFIKDLFGDADIKDIIGVRTF